MTFGLLKVSKTQEVVKGSKLVKINKKKVGSFSPVMVFIWALMGFIILWKIVIEENVRVPRQKNYLAEEDEFRALTVNTQPVQSCLWADNICDN